MDDKPMTPDEAAAKHAELNEKFGQRPALVQLESEEYLDNTDPVASGIVAKLYGGVDRPDPTIGEYPDDPEMPSLLWDAWRAGMRENGIPECGDDYEELSELHRKAIARVVELFAGSVDWQ